MTRIDYTTGSVIVTEDYSTVTESIFKNDLDVTKPFIQLTEAGYQGSPGGKILLRINDINAVFEKPII